MNWKSTLVLAVILLCLAGIVYYMNTVGAELRPTPTPSIEDKLWSLEPNQVTSFLLLDNKRQIGFSAKQPEAGTWQITRPREGPADNFQMSTLTSNLSGWYISRRITETINLDEIGLTDPAYVLTINLKDGSQIKVKVGNKTIGRPSYYVQREGEGSIAVVNSALVDGLVGYLDNPPFQLTPTPTVTGGATATATSTPAPVSTATATP